MNRWDRILWGIGGLAVAMFFALAVMSLGWLSPQGLSNFDARVLGYDLADARAYLAALPDRSRALYLGWFRALDTVFPVLAAVAIGGILWLNTPHWHAIRRAASLGMVAGYLLLDLAENSAVAQILMRGDAARSALVDRASDMTQLKWLFLALSLMLVGAVWRRRRERIA